MNGITRDGKDLGHGLFLVFRMGLDFEQTLMANEAVGAQGVFWTEPYVRTCGMTGFNRPVRSACLKISFLSSIAQ